MPKLTLDVNHNLGLEEATRRLKEKFSAALAEHRGAVSNFREEWIDHTFNFAFSVMGMAVSGAVAVEPCQVRLNAQIPLAASLFRGTIEQRLREEVASILR